MKFSLSLHSRWFFLLSFLFLSVTLVDSSLSQEIKILAKRPDGTYKVEIGGEEFSAFNKQHLERITFIRDSLKIELKAAKQRIEADSSLVATIDTTVAAYRRNFALKDSLVAQYKDLYIGYKDIYFDYKRKYSEPWLYFSGGIGAVRESSGDNDVLPIILFGLSIKRLSLWGFINSEQSGFIAGINYPIRFNLSFF